MFVAPMLRDSALANLIGHSLLEDTWQRALQKQIVFDNVPPYQVLLNDALKNLRRGTVIPNTIRVDQQNWPFLTNPQAIRFRPKYKGGVLINWNIQLKCLEALF